MTDTRRQREAIVANVLDGKAVAKPQLRRVAFDNGSDIAEPVRQLLDKVTRHAYKVTDQDVEAAKAVGLSEDEIFELCVCAALGQAQRQLDAALTALDATQAEKARAGGE
jgi:hypothetical protein